MFKVAKNVAVGEQMWRELLQEPGEMVRSGSICHIFL